MSETRPYQPSNGTEGEGFVAVWCDRCLHDRAVRLHEDYDNGCPILARAYAFKPGDPEYPTEWVYDVGVRFSERCTAFVEDDHDDDWEAPPPPDPTQLVLIADPTEDIAGIVPAPAEKIEVAHV